MAEGGWIGKEPGMDEEDLRQWCAKINRTRLAEQAGWWYYVRKDNNGVLRVHKLEGVHGDEARASVKGEYVEPYKPTDTDLASINKLITDCKAKGLTQAEFNALVDRTGGAPRR